MYACPSAHCHSGGVLSGKVTNSKTEPAHLSYGAEFRNEYSIVKLDLSVYTLAQAEEDCKCYRSRIFVAMQHFSMFFTFYIVPCWTNFLQNVGLYHVCIRKICPNVVSGETWPVEDKESPS